MDWVQERLVADGFIGERDPDLLLLTDDPDELVRLVCEGRERQER
jgi:hypothetical protein